MTDEKKEGPSEAGLGLNDSAPRRAGKDVPPVAPDSQSTKRPFVSYPIFRDGRRGIDFAAVNAHLRDEFRRFDKSRSLTAFTLFTVLFDEGLLRRTLKVCFPDKANLAIRCATNREEIDRALDVLVRMGTIEVLSTNGRLVSAEEARLARQGTAVDEDDAQPWLVGFDEPDLNEELAGERLRDVLRRLDGQASVQPTVATPPTDPFALLRQAAEGKASVEPTLPRRQAIAVELQPKQQRHSSYSRSWSELKEAALALTMTPAEWTPEHRDTLKGLVDELFKGDFGPKAKYRRYWNAAVREVPHVVTEVVALLAGEKHRGDKHGVTNSVAYLMMVDRGYANVVPQ
jgi:hypothetical protein